MTLRLIRDDERNVVPCEYGDGPATLLVIINETPGIPCCDVCAHRFYNMDPYHVRLASLDGYVDMFAAAKQAAFATPEQFTAPVPITASTALDDKVLRRIWADRVIYCRVHWCEKSRLLTPAGQRLNAIGGLWYPACQKCINEFDPDQVEIAPMSEDDTAWELGMADEYARDHHWSKPVSPALWWTAGISALVSFVLGGVMVAHENAAGLFFLALPVLFVIGAVVVMAIRDAAEEIQQGEARQATLTPGQQAAVNVAEVAALGAGAYAVHEELSTTESTWLPSGPLSASAVQHCGRTSRP
jgi:hypothetical protein